MGFFAKLKEKWLNKNKKEIIDKTVNVEETNQRETSFEDPKEDFSEVKFNENNLIWEEVSFAELGNLSRGKNISNEEELNLHKNKNRYIPYITNQDISNGRLNITKFNRYCSLDEAENTKTFPKGTVCILRNGNSAAILKEESFLASSVYGFNSFEGIADNKFIKYCFDYSVTKSNMRAIANAYSVIPGIPMQKLLSIKLLKPPFEIQRKIGNILSSYDEKIENIEKQIELLEKMRSLFYKEWIFKFKSQLCKKTNVNFLKGEGWDHFKIKDLTKKERGKTDPKYEIPEGEYLFFTNSLDSPKRIDEFIYDAPAIIFQSTGTFLVHLCRKKFNVGNSCLTIFPKNYSYFFLIFEAIKASIPYLFAKTTGKGSFVNFREDHLDNLDVIIPNKELLEKFNTFSEEIQLRIENLFESIKRLEKSKNKLFKMIFNQKIKIN